MLKLEFNDIRYTHIRTFLVGKEIIGIWFLEFENDKRVMETSFKIIIADFCS